MNLPEFGRKEIILYVAAQPDNSDSWMHWAHYEESLGKTGFALILHHMADKLKNEQHSGKRRFSVQDIDSYTRGVEERNVLNFLNKSPNFPYDPTYPIHESEWAYPKTEESERHTHFLLSLVQSDFSQDVIVKYAKEEQSHGNIYYAYGLTFYLINPSDRNDELQALSRELWSEFVTLSLKGENNE
jgi:hypothetical protein